MARSKEFNEEEALDKAMEIFWKQGYEKTSIQDLVDQMGIHRRSLYDTFGDKHSLFVQTLERYESLIAAQISNHQHRAIQRHKLPDRQLFSGYAATDWRAHFKTRQIAACACAWCRWR